ncbi:hypothetical protein [Alterisphingorhabdus coralli]|uniref:Uncharacterized protein n=1 Tax=Alterisphingorhabdus coralli TaxID=3071408 RepID=A0AA97F7V3_9SPHN|nr:hypothetical protein [Parasphingorhabdus sp. SCSIO 66989]WOE75541.1 hypothetical protein RB602_02170 [Parasphingorhabdus sp. SCSIO 66989]
MADNVTNELIYETLKAMQTKLVSLGDDVTDIKADMRGLKAHMAGFMQTELSQDGAISSIQSRLDRIEKRLELSDS